MQSFLKVLGALGSSTESSFLWRCLLLVVVVVVVGIAAVGGFFRGFCCRSRCGGRGRRCHSSHLLMMVAAVTVHDTTISHRNLLWIDRIVSGRLFRSHGRGTLQLTESVRTPVRRRPGEFVALSVAQHPNKSDTRLLRFFVLLTTSITPQRTTTYIRHTYEPTQD